MVNDSINKKRPYQDALASPLAKPATPKRLAPSTLARHPLGIKPWGNYLLDSTSPNFPGERRTPGLGVLAQLSDDTVLEIVSLLPARTVVVLSYVSKALYIFSMHEEGWRNRTIDELGGEFEWCGSWRTTYLKKVFGIDYGGVPLAIDRFYSDTLYHPFRCTSLDLTPYAHFEHGIERRANLSLEEFREKYELPNKPVILTDVVPQWPAFQNSSWTKSSLLTRYGDIKFRAEAIDITLREYFKYADTTADESPLYLFDKRFCENCKGMAEDFEVPAYFAEDLFAVLGEKRPDWRWIIVGPARSGSTFHKDPNSTSAWNAVLTGAKLWIMYPPHQLPPGVFTSPDESEVTSPVSIAEWFLNFYEQTLPSRCPPDQRPVQAVCRAGEIMFVPCGWWHLVVNLEESVAVTQNYVGSQNLGSVLRFLSEKRDQVSGVPVERREGLYEEFREKLQVVYPDLLARIEREEEERRLKARANKREGGWWDKLKGIQEGDKAASFSFGFGGSDDEE
ncbi:uncharacterized protein VTP21DRAFT_7589 [Calcarisporiella thermophila]|uniref:uncharacterized protein n=1 Tax=Calcarisporiella thermophila TaxID=911321 RepID=UPI0037449BC1